MIENAQRGTHSNIADAKVYYQTLGHMQGRFREFTQSLKCSKPFLKITYLQHPEMPRRNQH